MEFYQQVTFGLGVILLIFGMGLMVFRSAEGGVTRIKLPVVELELNGGALFVMVLGAGLIYFAHAPTGVGVGDASKSQDVVSKHAEPAEQEAEQRIRAAEAAKKLAEEKVIAAEEALKAREKTEAERAVSEARAAAEAAKRAAEKQSDAADALQRDSERAAADEARKSADAKIAALEDKLRRLEQAPAGATPPANEPKIETDQRDVTSKPGNLGTIIKKASLWSHNGSSIVLVADGPGRRFYYDNPRTGMLSLGVRNGTLLFEGVRRGDSYQGTAYVFSSGCQPMAFPVTGTVLPGDKEVVLSGNAPKRQKCQVVGRNEATLRFTFIKPVTDYQFSAGGE
jgi:hypothetical protein